MMQERANGAFHDGLFGTIFRRGIRFESARRTAEEFACLSHIAERLPEEICESIETIVADDGHFEVWLTESLPGWACQVLGGMMNAIILGVCGTHKGIGIYGRLDSASHEVKAQ